MNRKILSFALFSLLSFNLQAKTLADVSLSDETLVAGETLKLNGAGIRTKFVFDIYVAAFYTREPVSKLEDLIVSDQPMRMAMHFVYDEVSKEKLVDGWNEGFDDNLSDEQLNKLKPRIKLFNGLFKTVRKGDVILLDYVPGKGTLVTINHKNIGAVTGAEFYHALLMIWLGENPVGDDLKSALLGQIESDDE